MSGGQLGAVRASEWGPEDNGLLTWTYDPVMATAATSYASGDVGIAGAWLRRPGRATNLYISTTATAVGAVVGQNFLGLYDSSGNLLSNVAIDTQVQAAAGMFVVPLASSLLLQPGRYYAGMVQNAATSLATLTRANGAGDAAISANLSASSPRAKTILNGQTALPSPAVFSGGGPVNKGFWWALG